MELNVISIIQRKISHKNYSMRNTEIPNKRWYTTVNIWKSSIWTADKDMSMKAIFTVINTTWAVVKIRPEKIFSGLYGILTHHHCDALWNTTAVLQRSWVQIPYRPEFFSGLIFTTAQVVFITAKITFIFTKADMLRKLEIHRDISSVPSSLHSMVELE